MKKKMTKEEVEARIKRLEWVQSEIHRCVAQGLPVSSLKEKGIAIYSFNTSRQ